MKYSMPSSLTVYTSSLLAQKIRSIKIFHRFKIIFVKEQLEIWLGSEIRYHLIDFKKYLIRKENFDESNDRLG